MPELTIWTPEEMADRAKPKRARQREQRERMVNEYSDIFSNVGAGFGGQVVLEEGDDKRKVRAIIREAADRQQLSLRFRPIKDKQRIEFRVLDASEIATTKKTGARRGRPKSKKTS